MRPQLNALRETMRGCHITACLIPTADYHGSEYAGAHFAARAYLSGFTGSAGTLLVLRDWAGLWTDGRYFLQAEAQLAGTGITLMREGTPEVPSPAAFLAERLGGGEDKPLLAFDGRCVSAREALLLQKKLQARGIALRTDLDLPGEIWDSRPPLSAAPAWLLPDRYAGESRGDKLTRTRAALAEQGADRLLLTSLTDIGWLLNLRGGDLPCTPVLLAYLSLTDTSCRLFANPACFTEEIREALEADGVLLEPYDAFYKHVAHGNVCAAGKRVWLDRRRVNARLAEVLPPAVAVLDRPAPTEGFKAVKNPVERDNMRQAHLYDGVALTKFLFWLSETVGKELVTERSAAARLEGFRRDCPDFLDNSFAPIAAYGPHGAIVHYEATEVSDVPLEPRGFLLLDTGGHYWQGTTDCTRTVLLGTAPPTEEMRRDYTAVLRGHIRLATARFPNNTTGQKLDALARSPLWEQGLDFNHGTGHGVGYLLSVHEPPQAFRPKSSPADAVLQAGMITSDEPGVYRPGQYGIRLESLLLCVPGGATAFGDFLQFETLTLVPFDPRAVDFSALTKTERDWLLAYHQRVYAALSPYLTKDERRWLRTHTERFRGIESE
jgi:Xaa-Pro aminopeptidase